MSVFITIIAILLLIMFHELGHFWAAKALGVQAYAFSVGFGPKLWSRKSKAGTIWYLRALPFGGYCSFDDLEKVKMKSSDLSQAMNDAALTKLHPMKQALVYLAGPIANVLLTFLVMLSVYVCAGQLRYTSEIGGLVPGGAAEMAGMITGDTIIGINGVNVNGEGIYDEVQVQSRAGDPMYVTVEHSDGQQETLKVQPTWDGTKWELGVYQATKRVAANPLTALKMAFDDTKFYVTAIYQSIIDLVARRVDSDDVVGVVGAVSLLSNYAKSSQVFVFFCLLSVLSANLAVMNLLPIPALDGARICVAIWESITRKKVQGRAYSAITALSFIIVMGLVVFLGVRDIMHIISFD